MPYSNLDKSKWNKMEEVTSALKKKGMKKGQLYGTAYNIVMGLVNRKKKAIAKRKK